MSARKKVATPKKAAADAAGGPMKPGGDSDSWEAQKGNQKNIGTQFLKEGLTDAALKAEAGEEWGKMPEAVACKPEIYEHLATYLCDGYRIANDCTSLLTVRGAEKGRWNPPGIRPLRPPRRFHWGGVRPSPSAYPAERPLPKLPLPPRPETSPSRAETAMLG